MTWTPLPEPEVSAPALRVLLALLAEHRDHGYASVRTVAARAGYASPGTVHLYLRELKAAGLADWEPGLAGTLRPAVAPVLALA